MLLYIHIPFCVEKCNYCSFISYTKEDNLKQNYMKALLEQFKNEVKRFNTTHNAISSIFFGGGTPSVLEAKMYEDFFTLINPYLNSTCEVTMEANPNSATFEWLEGVKKLGVNRISFGVQSFDEKKLQFLGRSHNQKDIFVAVENAKKVGIKNISIDLIYGTSHDTKELLSKDLEYVTSLKIEHLSAYSLTLEKGTKFYGKTQFLNTDEEFHAWFINSIKQSGFTQYEISNFGSPCLHNLGYWEYKPYIGLGCGAVGFDGQNRLYPPQNIKEYIKNHSTCRVEPLSNEDIKFEKLFLGFRSIVGVEMSLFEPKELEKVAILLSEKKLYQKDNRFYNTDYLLSDELVLFISE